MGQNMGQICGLETDQPCRQLLPPDGGSGEINIVRPGANALTHTLTHTTISASGEARMYWTDNLRVSSKMGLKTAKSRCVATES